MATITGFTAEHMQEIEDTTVVDGNILGDNLILVKRNGEQIDAGNVRGAQGPQGIQGAGATTLDGLNDVVAPTPATGDAVVWTGTAWVNKKVVTVAATAPSSPAVGDLWVDTSS